MGVLVETESPSSTFLPPPKKKWIRHYMLGEEPKDYHTFSTSVSPPSDTLGPSPSPSPPRLASPPASCSPPATTAPPSGVPPTHYHHHHHHHHSHPHPNPHLPNELRLEKQREVTPTTNHALRLEANHAYRRAIASHVPTTEDLQVLRRRTGAGTREVHNKLEKHRRAHLKECFELLKKQLPAQDDKKTSNLNILSSAVRYIQTLKRKERDYEHEMERLAREKIAAQQRLASLKKELSAQWDHLDFGTLLPDINNVEPDRERDSRSTSTASELDGHLSDMDEVRGLKRTCNAPPLSSRSGMYSSASSLSSTSPPRSSSSQFAGVHWMAYREDQPSPPGLPLSTPSPPTASVPATAVSTSAPRIASVPAHVQLQAQQMVQTTTLMSSSIQVLAPPGMRVLSADPTCSTSQPLALTVHTPPVSVSGEGASINIPTIHLNAKGTPSLAYVTGRADPRPNGMMDIDRRLPSQHKPLQTSKASPINLSTSMGKLGLAPTPVALGGLAIPGSVISHTPVSLTSKASSALTANHGLVPTSEGLLTPTCLSGAGPTCGNGTTSATMTVSQIPGHAFAAGIAHLVGPVGGHSPLSGLVSGNTITPLVAPVTVMAQGGQVAHILASTHLGNKVVSPPLLKSMSQLPIMNAQYLNATALGATQQLCKPVMVVSSHTTAPTSSTTSPRLDHLQGRHP